MQCVGDVFGDVMTASVEVETCAEARQAQNKGSKVLFLVCYLHDRVALSRALALASSGNWHTGCCLAGRATAFRPQSGRPCRQLLAVYLS